MNKVWYGVKLVSYKGQTMNMFVFEDGKRYEASYLEAFDKKAEYTSRNPDGRYVVQEI